MVVTIPGDAAFGVVVGLVAYSSKYMGVVIFLVILTLECCGGLQVLLQLARCSCPCDPRDCVVRSAHSIIGTTRIRISIEGNVRVKVTNKVYSDIGKVNDGSGRSSKVTDLLIEAVVIVERVRDYIQV